MPLKITEARAGRSTYWYIRGTYRGRTIDCSTKTTNKKDAEKFKRRLEDELDREFFEKRKPGTFRLAAEMYVSFRRPFHRDKRWIDRLVAELGEVDLADIKQSTIITAANKLYPGRAPETKNRQVIGVASTILHYAAENGLCHYTRFRKFKEKRPEGRALPRAQAERLIAAADGKMQTLLIWLFCQGWRVSDVLRVKWSDIDLIGANVRYHISKTDEYRLMPLHPRVVASLKQYRDEIGRVFPWSEKSNLYRALKAKGSVLARTGINFTPHMARHSFATWLANEGVSSLELMEAGGWTDPKSVQRYAKLDPTRVRSIIGKI